VLRVEASYRWLDSEGNIGFTCDAPDNEWTVRIAPPTTAQS
jgi:hypothetical protein